MTSRQNSLFSSSLPMVTFTNRFPWALQMHLVYPIHEWSMRLGGYSQFDNVIFGHQRQGKWFRNFKDNKLYCYTNYFNLNLHLWTLMFTQQDVFPCYLFLSRDYLCLYGALRLFTGLDMEIKFGSTGRALLVDRRVMGLSSHPLSSFPVHTSFTALFHLFATVIISGEWTHLFHSFPFLSFLWKLVSNTG